MECFVVEEEWEGLWEGVGKMIVVVEVIVKGSCVFFVWDGLGSLGFFICVIFF